MAAVLERARTTWLVNTVTSLESNSTELLVDVARRFYLQGESKVDIGQSLGISRFKVARMLDDARSRGIVHIDVTEPPRRLDRQARLLADHLGLERVELVQGVLDTDEERNRLGREGARVMLGEVGVGDVVGLSWGRTLLPMAAHLDRLPASTLVQLTGMVGNDPSSSPVEIMSRILRASKVKAMALLAPLFAATPELAAAFRQEPAVHAVLNTYRNLDFAVLSIGSWNPPVTQLGELFDESTTQEIDHSGAVAELAGIFLSAEGECLDLSVDSRRIAVTPDELLRTPKVMAVAGGLEKTDAIRSVVCSGTVNVLVTTSEVADCLLRLPPVTRKALSRPT